MTLPGRASAAVVALLLLTAAAFWPGLDGGWLFDDHANIVRDARIHVDSLDVDSLREAMGAYGGPLGRPLATASFAVDHAIAGLDPWQFKFTSLLVHLLNAALVFALARRLLPPASGSMVAATAPAFALALAWAIHPYQVSTVLYVVQRMEMLSATFVLLALLAYLRGRRAQIAGVRGWPWIAAAGALAAAGLLAKETAVLSVPFALALEWTVLAFAAADARTSRRWRAAYAVAVVAGILAFALWVAPPFVTAETYAIRDFGPMERVLTQLRVLPMYLGDILLPRPADFQFYYDNLAPSRGLLSPPTTLAGGVLLLGLAVLAWALRRRVPLFSLGIMWFFAAHLLTSNVLPLELAFEHRNYFALFGVLLAVTALVLRLPRGDASRLRPVTVGIVLAGLVFMTVLRSATWGDPLQLAMSLAGRNPTSSRASMDLGEQYMLLARGDATSRFYRMAEEEFERGAALPGASAMPDQGLIVLAAVAGQPAKPEWWDRIASKLRERAIGPQEMSMVAGLLGLRHEGLVFDDARYAETYIILLERMQVPPGQVYAFADHALTFLGDRALAGQLYALAVDAGDLEFAAAVAEALHDAGHDDMAKIVVDRARANGLGEIVLPAREPAGEHAQ
jgi:protein O-mannosyl-transferase